MVLRPFTQTSPLAELEQWVSGAEPAVVRVTSQPVEHLLLQAKEYLDWSKVVQSSRGTKMLFWPFPLRDWQSPAMGDGHLRHEVV